MAAELGCFKGCDAHTSQRHRFHPGELDVGWGADPLKTRIIAYVAPITHAAGGGVLASLLSGATNLLLQKFEPSAFLHTVEDMHVNDVLLVPTMINMLLECPEIRERDLSSLETIIYGTSPMAPERTAPQDLRYMFHDTLPSPFLLRLTLRQSPCGSGDAVALEELSPDSEFPTFYMGGLTRWRHP